MSEQNRYRIDRYYQKATGEWRSWVDDGSHETADTWQDATRKWLDDMGWIDGECQVIAKTPSEDSKSGTIEIQFDTPGVWVRAKIQATLIED